MKGKGHSPEQIVRKLREADLLKSSAVILLSRRGRASQSAAHRRPPLSAYYLFDESSHVGR